LESDGLVICIDHLLGKIYSRVEIGINVPVIKIQLLKTALNGVRAAKREEEFLLEFTARDPDTLEPGHVVLIADEKYFLKIFTRYLQYLVQTRVLTKPIICCKFDHEH
jgi:hypothetical protein